MTEPKHTPGPWQVHHENKVCRVIRDEQLEIIGWCDVNNEANANLIAAAPDMYEALEEVIKIYSFKEMVRTDKTINSPRDDPDRGKIFFTYNDLSKARKALRKARGEAE